MGVNVEVVDNMATNTFIEIDLPEAADLADLTGIHYDLESARSFAQTLKRMFESGTPNWELVDPLSTAILVRYSRPFVKGVRKWLGDESLHALTGPQRAKHQRLRDFRNKHIAHSVNAFEDNQPIARYWLERVHEKGITSVECNHTRITGLSSADLEDVIELTTAILSYVESCLTQEKAKVLDVVRKMPIDRVLSGGRKGPALPDLKKIDKSRKQRRLLTPRSRGTRAKTPRTS